MDYMQTPLYVGTLKLRQGENGYRPKRFTLRTDGNDEIKDPKDALDLLRSVSRIMVDRRSDMSEFTSMLSDFQFAYDLVDVCRICLLNDRFNFLNTESIGYKGELICENCAKDELEHECSYKKVGEATFNMLLRMLHKTRDLNRILAMLDPTKLDPELTRFDTIESVTTHYNIDVATLPLHTEFKKLLTMEQLLPVQSLSIRGGLLNGQNQLIISATATGKTLIGELAGIENILNNKGNMLFLVPLVALANQKHEQFKKRYSSLGIKTYLRIGGGRIKELRSNVEIIPLGGVDGNYSGTGSDGVGEISEKPVQEPRPQSRSIFVGTYEGVDQMIRAGTIGRLGHIGTVVIDEVHMLEDEERGPRLDGLISRLKYLFSKSQYIFLSATVGNPKQLAQGLESLLIQYEERPVPLERHLIFTTQRQKLPFIRRLASEAYSKKSSKGYRGQTIIFTNSRHNCTMISSSIDSPNLHAAAYHAGLPPNIRKKVELGFEKGHIAVVVTTAALAAGVDFPASQVIFETLAMGIEWLKSSEFMQMQGRAGRPDYHDLGTVVLLVEPEKRYSNQGMAEDDVAVRLLEGNVEDINVEYDERAQLEQTLADAACIAYNQIEKGAGQASLNALKGLHEMHLGHFDLKFALKRLKEYGFVERENIRPTRFGKIVTTHFLDTDSAFIMYDMIKDGQNPIDILVQLSTFVNVFFKHQGALSKTLGTNVPKKVFQGAALDIVFSGEGLSQLEGAHQQELIDFALDFLSCTCRESPYCGCPEQKFSRKLIEARASGKDVAVVIDDAYGIYAYTADLLNYFDDCVRNLEAVILIAKLVGNEKVRKDATNLLKSMS